MDQSALSAVEPGAQIGDLTPVRTREASTQTALDAPHEPPGKNQDIHTSVCNFTLGEIKFILFKKDNTTPLTVLQYSVRSANSTPQSRTSDSSFPKVKSRMGSIGSNQDGQEQVSPSNNTKTPYVIKEEPIGTLRRVRIVTIGAGVSGINLIRTLKLHTSNFEHVVYEKNPDIGGTWYENRYPGLRCDIPSHNYQFSHTPNPSWNNLFAEAGDIEKYLHHVCDVHGLRGAIKVSHSVVHAHWEESSGEWLLKVKNEVTCEEFDDRCHFLVDASGILKWVEPITTIAI